jgi:hypothetical protein
VKYKIPNTSLSQLHPNLILNFYSAAWCHSVTLEPDIPMCWSLSSAKMLHARILSILWMYRRCAAHVDENGGVSILSRGTCLFVIVFIGRVGRMRTAHGWTVGPYRVLECPSLNRRSNRRREHCLLWGYLLLGRDGLLGSLHTTAQIASVVASSIIAVIAAIRVWIAYKSYLMKA